MRRAAFWILAALFASLPAVAEWTSYETPRALPGSDAVPFLRGSADGSKRLRVEVDGFTTGQTRVWTAPDQNVDFTPGTGTFASSANGELPVADTIAVVEGSADATKLLRFEVDGFTTGTTRVLTPPNFDGTIATTAGVETLTGKTMTSAANVIDADTAVALAADPADCAANAFATTIAASGALTCATPALGADTSGNFVASANTSALTGLTGGSAGSEGAALSLAFDYSATLAADPALAASACVFGTTGLICEGATANGFESLVTFTDPTADRTITMPDASGEVSLLGQTIGDAELVSNYSGVGACAAGNFVNAANDNASPTCAVDMGDMTAGYNATSLDQTFFCFPDGGPSCSATSGFSTEERATQACAARALHAAVATAPGVGSSWTVALTINDVASALTCSIAGTNTECNDLSNSVTLEVSDRIEISFTEVGTAIATGGQKFAFACRSP